MRRRKHKGGGRRSLYRRLCSRWIRLGLVCLVIFGAWVSWIDHRLRVQFDGHRWSLPARVYARPFELYPGRPLHRAEIISELGVLGYQEASLIRRPGQYQQTSNAVRLFSHGYRFWDGEESSRMVEIRLHQGRVQAIIDRRSGTQVALMRLEPLEIARIYPHHNEDRILVKIDDVPSMLVQGLIAAEDKAYPHHFGIDPLAIGRAFIENLRAGKVRQGGSTLTQQLVKNLFLSSERTLWRKINEAVMAVLLEWHYSKAEILEAYINEIFLGQDGFRAIHGFGLGARFYFGRPLRELQVHELALLVGLVRGASYYDPRRHPKRALQRRNQVLALMIDRGALTPEAGGAPMKLPLTLSKKNRSATSNHPAFVDLVRRQLGIIYDDEDLRNEGLQIFTTLDPQTQRRTEQALRASLSELERQKRMQGARLQGAVVAAAIDTGEVLALAGGRDPRFAGFNRALDAKRPVGSLVKPAVYLAALSQPSRYNLITPLSDSPIVLRERSRAPWSPQNYDKRYHGRMPLMVALAESNNVATVRLGIDLGIDRVRRTLAQLGVSGEVPPYPSTFLGAIEMSPLEVAQMYQTLSSGGFYSALRAIRDVVTKDGQPLQRYGLTVKQVLPAAPVYLINYALAQVVRSGTASSLGAKLPQAMPLAGKTGTTDGLRDSWFVGFGSDVLAAVWLGADDNRPIGLTGASGAMRVWYELMKERPPVPLDLAAPRGVEWQWVDARGMARTTPSCPGARRYPFITPFIPSRQVPCDGHEEAEYARAPRGLFW
ncbi:penicillin-binding protein 1B [soil metagenome]